MHALETYLESFSRHEVACMGDVMLDCFLHGSVDRISPEAPVPVFKTTQKTQILGGAGNVVRNLNAVKVPFHFLSVVGADNAGHRICNLLDQLNPVSHGLVVDPQRETTLKKRYIAQNQHLLRVDEESTYPLSLPLQQQLFDQFEALTDTVKTLILSDYGKGIFNRSFLKCLIEKAKDQGMSILVDPKNSDFSWYEGATVLKPNLKELSQAWGQPLTTQSDIEHAAVTLLQRHGIQYMLITQGGRGMTLVDHTGEVHHIPTQALEVFDVSGAGDTVMAVFAAAFGAGVPPRHAAELANIAAGIVVGKIGTATPSLREIQEQISDQQHHKGVEKVHILRDGQDQIIKWRRQGLKVGFTNGCFDLLHPGHLSLLKQARAACDRLVVGLNSDDSVKRLKGPQRPLQHHEARATVLSGLESVDMVIVFEEDTPFTLIQALRPDVLIKGADYSLENVVGGREVISWGGEVILASLIPNQSTTKTIQRMG